MKAKPIIVDSRPTASTGAARPGSIRLTMTTPIAGSPQANRRFIYCDLTIPEALGLARSLEKLADRALEHAAAAAGEKGIPL